MINHTQKALDFIKIKQRLKNFIFSPLGIEAVDELSLLSYDDILYELELLDSFSKELSFNSFPAQQYDDIRAILKLCERTDSFLEVPEFLILRDFLAVLKNFRNFFAEIESENLKIEFYERLNFPESFEIRLLEVMDSEGNIRDKASPALFEIRKEMHRIKAVIEEKLKSILKDPDASYYLQEALFTMKDNRWVLPLKANFKGRIKGLVISSSNTGETLFIEPHSIVEENNQFKQLKAQEKIEIIKILKRLTSAITNNMQSWLQNLEQLKKLELLYAKYSYAKKIKAVKPVINQNHNWQLKKARHPLLDRPVPIDIELGEHFNILIITGPNTGGKTAALKTLGLLTLMANCALFIPAQIESTIPYIQNIFVDIGDEQSITQNLSTFSAHIQNIKNILRRADENSLILIDEIGAGTDPKDGASLAVALIEGILERKSFALITSHLEKVKNMAFYHDKIENASVEFDLRTLSPRYRLRTGITGKSYGLEIAKRLGLDETIVNRAKELSIPGEQAYNLEKILDKLNKETKRYQDRKKQYDNMVFNLNKKSESLYQKENELKKLEQSLTQKEGAGLLEELKKRRRELISLIEEAKKQKNIDTLREKARSLENISEDTHQILKESTALDTSSNPQEKQNWTIDDLSPGDQVLIKKFQKQGELLSVQKEKKVLTVMLGALKMKLAPEEIELISKKKEEVKEESTKVHYSVNTNSQTPLELKIIGKRREEALVEVENYVHKLALKNAAEGVVIHGKGTGILKQAVIDYFSESPLVKEWKTRPDGGATLFKLS